MFRSSSILREEARLKDRALRGLFSQHPAVAYCENYQIDCCEEGPACVYVEFAHGVFWGDIVSYYYEQADAHYIRREDCRAAGYVGY